MKSCIFLLFLLMACLEAFTDDLSKRLAVLDKDIVSNYNSINSVIVSNGNSIVFEKYYNGYTESYLFPVYSVTKTITALGVGICIDKSLVNSTKDDIKKYLPKYKISIDSEDMTIQDLLTMTDGLEYKESTSILISSNDLVSYFVGLKKKYSPGEHFRYSSVNAQVLSKIIENVTHQTEAEFINNSIFTPLGIDQYNWLHDKQNTTYGGFGLNLQARDMLKIGILLLNNGNYEGKKIVSSKWIEEMTTIKNNGGGPHNEKYGLHCWITNVKGYTAFFAGGFGGQFIYIIPELRGIIVITSRANQHHESNRNIVSDHIVEILESIE